MVGLHSIELMARSTRVLGFSVPPALAREYERLAKREGLRPSELFRVMIAAYKVRRAEEEFFRLQRRMARRAGSKGIFTERQVDRLVFQDR
jgi:transposase InsO family protein